jgi:hypothetical protein
MVTNIYNTINYMVTALHHISIKRENLKNCTAACASGTLSLANDLHVQKTLEVN